MLNRQKLQSFIDSYKDKFIKDLDETCKDLLDTNDTNLIDLDQEYDIPKCDYIKTEPMIHLDAHKIFYDIDNIKYKFIKNNMILKLHYQNIKPYSNEHNEHNNYNSYNIVNNCPINIKLNINEYIIKVYYYYYEKSKSELIYITNYGRFISNIYGQYNFDKHYYEIREKHEYYYKTYEEYKEHYTNKNFNVVIYNEIVHCEYNEIKKSELNIKTLNNIQLIPQPELNYKMPKIFIDVIDAFHTQNTDLMQTCCKKYLDILNKTKNVDKIIEKDMIIKNQQEQLLEKDKEIERLKLELEELKKFYINS